MNALTRTYFISQLPGVDPNDPAVKDLLASLQSQSEVFRSTDLSCMFVCQICPYNFWLFSFPIVISLNKRRMKTSHQMMKSESFWWHSFYINDRLATSMVSLLYCIADFFFFFLKFWCISVENDWDNWQFAAILCLLTYYAAEIWKICTLHASMNDYCLMLIDFIHKATKQYQQNLTIYWEFESSEEVALFIDERVNWIRYSSNVVYNAVASHVIMFIHLKSYYQKTNERDRRYLLSNAKENGSKHPFFSCQSHNRSNS